MGQRYWVIGGHYQDCRFRELEPGTEVIHGPYSDELKARMESEWMPELQRILGLETSALPVIWDRTSCAAATATPSSARSTSARPLRSRSTPCRAWRGRRGRRLAVVFSKLSTGGPVAVAPQPR